MKYFIWDENLETGLSDLDDPYQQRVQIITLDSISS